MNTHGKFLWILTLLLLVRTSAYGEQLRIIELKHRTADEIIHIVTPLLGSEDTISGRGFTVILNTAPERAGRIESIIRTLDKPARQLLVTVVQGEKARQALESIDISGKLSIGDHASVEFGRTPQPDDAVALNARSGRSAINQVDIQRLRVQEGMPAVLFIGQMLPVSTQTVDSRSRSNRITFQQVRTGFEVVPRLSGNRFVLDIVAQRESAAADGSGAVATQLLQTQIQGRLDEWIDIGKIVGTSLQSESGFVYSDERQREHSHPVYLKVEEIAR